MSAARPILRALVQPLRRTLHTTPLLRSQTAPIPARKPVGAFRGGLLGFFTGSTLAGAAMYYYVIQEYKTTNELLTEDIYALQNAITRVASHITTVEDKIEVMKKK